MILMCKRLILPTRTVIWAIFTLLNTLKLILEWVVPTQTVIWANFTLLNTLKLILEWVVPTQTVIFPKIEFQNAVLPPSRGHLTQTTFYRLGTPCTVSNDIQLLFWPRSCLRHNRAGRLNCNLRSIYQDVMIIGCVLNSCYSPSQWCSLADVSKQKCFIYTHKMINISLCFKSSKTYAFKSSKCVTRLLL